MDKLTKDQKIDYLRSGLPVHADGHIVQAKRLLFTPSTEVCHHCEMDSLCKNEIAELCEEINRNSKKPYYLVLWHY